jgi:ribonuclease VapC
MTISGRKDILVVDSSALVCIVLAEPQADWVVSQMNEAPFSLKMSTVNLTEALIVVEYRRPAAAASLQTLLTDMPIDFVAPTTQHAFIAARARQRFPLNLGDCFAYALAVTENLPILTLDTDFLGVDVPVILPPGASALK